MSDSPSSPVSMAVGAVQGMRSFVGRGAKVGGPVAALCGAVADLASTIGKFCLWLFFISLLMAIISGTLWFIRYRREYQAAAADGVLAQAELEEMREHNVWSITFAFSIIAALVMGGFVVAEKMSGGEDKGALATVVPGMDKLQEAIFRVEKKVEAVKEDTEAIRKDTTATRQDTARIAASVEDIAKRFDSLNVGKGGFIENAKTPEEHYHNARFREVEGNFGAARKEYAEFLNANLELIDPWQSYLTMLKAQEGRAGAAETIRYFGEKLKPPTIAYETTLALLEEGEKRIAKLQALAAAHPDYGPLPYLLSLEFSEARKGDQTLADQRAEKEWLEKFRAAQKAGQVDRFFIDQRESQKWAESADSRWAKLANARVLENPVTLQMQESNGGWAIIFTLSDFKAKDLSYRLDAQGDFQSTGHLPGTNPQTGLPYINTHVPLPNLVPGEHSVEVKYTDKEDKVNGPYSLKFSTGDQRLSQGKMMLNATIGSWLSFRDFDGKTLLYFTGVLSYRPILSEIRYSLDNDTLDRTFKFKPSDKMYEPGDDIYLAVPGKTTYAAVQVTFKDGTKSSLQKIMRGK